MVRVSLKLLSRDSWCCRYPALSVELKDAHKNFCVVGKVGHRLDVMWACCDNMGHNWIHYTKYEMQGAMLLHDITCNELEMSS
jgi:hypothetical protein